MTDDERAQVICALYEARGLIVDAKMDDLIEIGKALDDLKSLVDRKVLEIAGEGGDF